MEPDLIRLAEAHLSPALIQRASALVGESQSNTQRALHAAIPALYTGLAAEAGSASGAHRVMEVIDEGGFREGVTLIQDRLAKGRGEEVIEGGKALLARLLPGRSISLSDSLAGTAGVKTSSMSSLLGLAAPLVLGSVGREVQARGLDAPGLAAMLRGAQPSTRVSATAENGRVAHSPAERPAHPAGAATGLGRFWPLLLVIPLALAGAFWIRRPSTTPLTDPPPRGLGAGLPPTPPDTAPPAVQPPAEVSPEPADTVPAPAPVDTVPAPEGISEGTVAYEMHEYLAGGGNDGVKRWIVEELTFAPASAQLPGRSIPMLDGLAVVMKAHPEARLMVEGHTDDSGPPAGNVQLSKARADAVKSALVGRGVDADRIETAGVGPDRPVASNDTPEGRAMNRRTEVALIPR